ncbi:MAG: tripartite tricarboxylate transporter permease [Candidatus Jordarchaeaceae archaeon]
MDLLQNILYGFSVSMKLGNLLACFLGVLIGTLIGVLPGLGPVATMSILLPISFKMPPTSAIIMMAGIYYGAMYGGSTTSILLNIPGEAASVVTCLDGYQMARQGRAGPALAIAAFSSFIAGTMGVGGLMFLAPMLAMIALRFGPPEIFGILILSFTMITQLTSGSKRKGAAMAALGLILGTVGLDPMVLTPRFTYGSISLMDGIGLAPLVMGLFGLSEVFLNIEKKIKQEVFKTEMRKLLPSRQDWKDSGKPIIRGGLVGFFLGLLPGIGAIIPTFISYALEKRLSKHPEKFGRGAIEGVAGPEAANNSATAGTMVPLLTLGIPPNVVMAVLMGAFLTHGIQPGPLLLKEHPDIFWGVITSMYTGNILLLILNLPLIGLWVRLLKVPYGVLFPLIFLFCLIGVYSIAGNIWDIVIMVVFSVVGYLMKKFDYEAAPLVLAFVLGRMTEETVRQSLTLSRGDLSVFFKHPISCIAILAALVIVLSPLIFHIVKRTLKRT